ncbi:MAG: RNA polymerase factor sigma-54 [Gammaproteobacteria bacterium]|nr:RNA polymerase factor sigma-54 [Gammaproteobacteria bacterium]
MKQTLQLKLGQHLTMTPQLQQAIRLLQLSSLELRQEVQEALDSNMMLELDDGEPGEFESGSAVERALDSGDGEARETGDGFGAEAEEIDSAGSTSEIPEDLPVDSQWDDIFDTATATSATASGREDGETSEFERFRSTRESLQDHLLWQVNLLNLSATDRAIVDAIVDTITPDGYLDTSIDELRETLSKDEALAVDNDEIEAMLKLVQTLDPTGVGARNLSECLLLQLRQFAPDTPRLELAQLVCRDYLDQLGSRDFSTLLRRLRLTPEELQQVVNLIQSLNPRPGSRYTDEPVEYVVPEVFVRKHNGVWRVELNPDALPQLRVNPHYASMIRRADSSVTNNTLKSHLREARWFIKSLQSRSETLHRVASEIVRRQRDFLEHGDEAMKPLVLHDIAEALELHESTVSRVTTRKYMHTPRGIFALKYFFSSHVATDAGGEASSTAIRAVIRKIIAAEHANKPLSDSKIASILSAQGIMVARRTVAKYREAMAIPPSNERKRLS